MRVYTSRFFEKAKLIKEKSDAVSRPTKEYTDMSFGMGQDGFPVVNVTQFAAKMYCEFLSAKTGHYYRLPTEAEWEYACRAGTTTAFSWGDDYKQIEKYAWYYENSGERYQKVGTKKPNPWGLHDMHGNVAEWCLDQYLPEFYKQFENQKKAAVFPVAIPTTVYPRIVRGGSWYDDAEIVRSASRQKSERRWKTQDPEIAQSMWWNTDSSYVGFRVIRPLKRPTDDEIKKYSLLPIPPEEQMTEVVLKNKCK